MLKQKDKAIIKHLRENSRKSLTKISKETNIPVSTIHDKLKRLESGVIKRHVSLIDFSKLNYSIKVHFVVRSEQKNKLKSFLMSHFSVNTISSVINNYDFYIECIFKDLKELDEFKEELQKFKIKDIQETMIVEELKKEDFGL